MIRSCVTIALVPQIKTGPWIFWEDLESGMAKAAELGFDAIELFTPSADTIDSERLLGLLEQYELKLAAVGTGAGKVIHGLTLTDADPEIRKKAISFISEMISFRATFGAPAIIGSMQGNVLPGMDREQVMNWLTEGLNQLGNHAGFLGVPLIYEPLNRYETNLLNTLDERARYAVEARFGMHDGERKSFRQVGEELGVTAEAARRLVSRAVDSLRDDAGDFLTV